MPDKFQPTRTQKVLLGGTFLSSLALSFVIPTRSLTGAALAGSAGLLLWCYDEYFSLAAFRPAEPPLAETRAQINASVARWYSAWMSSLGPTPSIIFLSVAVASASRWLYIARSTSSTTVIALHAAGLALTIAHMPFGSGAFALLPYIRGDKLDNGMDPLKALERWLQMHVRRCLLVDLPATLCFTAALFYA